jgi:CubicO group peptidase (beta-lactamase class C family)
MSDRLHAIIARTARRVALATALAASGASAIGDVSANDVPAPRPDELKVLTDYFDNEVATGKLPGAVILIQQHGGPVYQKCFGVRDVATRLPMTPDTIFALHSMTKPITSVAAMMLIDEGRLSVDDPVSKYIPSFTNMKVGLEKTDAHGIPDLEIVPADRPITIWTCSGIPPRSAMTISAVHG